MAAEADVVVVGAGAAGCVVAARLAAASHRSILLLEAGPDRRANLPPGYRNGWDLTRDLDWGYVAEPDRNGVARKVTRTKMLGGSSWLTRFTPRGHPADYDAWVQMGNPGWGFDDVLPYFIRLEDDSDFGEDPWHGNEGPMPSTRYLDLEFTEMAEAGLSALEAVGLPRVADHNRPGAVGAGRMPMNSRGGRRVTTADAYLPLGGAPENVTVRSETHVASIVFDGLRAIGVALVDDEVICADRVVVCAGTYGSPAILLRSGIGPADQLRRLGVPVRVDLPGVGENLTDHPAIDVDCGYGGTGRDEPSLHSIGTFHSSGRSSKETPDLMFWLTDPAAPGEEPSSFEIALVLLRPRSRGSVRLRSAAPSDSPLITLPDLSDPSDVRRLAEGYLLAMDVASRPQVRRMCSGAPPDAPQDPDDLLTLIREEAYSVPHVVGTCAMGPLPSEGAVVNAFGDVYGAEQLSVVDASVMPDVPSGFTHVPTIMIAERLSEQIRATA